MLSLAWISLAALVVVIVLSCTTAVNPGFVSLALAWVIGIYLAPMYGRGFTVGVDRFHGVGDPCDEHERGDVADDRHAGARRARRRAAARSLWRCRPSGAPRPHALIAPAPGRLRAARRP